ncbi:MAG: membrane protease YdiL (CAAX protease family) [Pirellulaceae bacterium]|jgi:membrane protease YdiL (CAAX protease family)
MFKTMAGIFGRKVHSPPAQPDDEIFHEIPWRSSDAALGIAALMPWLALNMVSVPSFAQLWFGGGLLCYEAIFILLWTRNSIRNQRGWRGILLGIAIAIPWICFGLFGPMWLRIPSVWWAFYIYQSALLMGVPYWLAKHRATAAEWPKISVKMVMCEIAFAIPVLIGIFLLIYASNFLWHMAGYGSGVRWKAWLNAAEVGGVTAMFTLMALSFTLVPIAEEVFFRGFLFNSLSRSVSFAMGLFAQAIFFAAMHPNGFIGLCVLALILAGVYQWRKTIVAPIVVHAGHNLLYATYFTWTLVISVYTPIFGIHGTDGDKITVTLVRPNATAHLSGIENDDVIATFNGHGVKDLQVLHGHVTSTKVGETVPVVVIRHGEELTLPVTMRNRYYSVGKSP